MERKFFMDVIWLGGPHDGHPVLPLHDYTKARPKPDNAFAFAALTQSEMTFGLLEAVMETQVPENMLLRKSSDGAVVLTSTNMKVLLQKWHDRIKHLRRTDLNRCQIWANRVNQTLIMVSRLLTEKTRNATGRTMLSNKTSLIEAGSIFNCIASIFEVVRASRILFPSQNVQPVAPLNCLLDLSDDIRSSMVTSGWCRFIVYNTLSLSACVLGYARDSGPPPSPDSDFSRHQFCTNEKCIIHNINPSSYYNPHAKALCNCDYAKPSLDSVVGALKKREIPVIDWVPKRKTQDRDGSIRVRTSVQTKFVAISHVWYDGLGSVTEKGLPICQIEFLGGLVENVAPGRAFWIDSICVPEMREMRNIAIGLMVTTYRSAELVLVIDSAIRSCSIFAPLEVKLLRILCSVWMQRLWTLQEGILAQKLVFAFSDGFHAIEELIPLKEDDLVDPLIVGLASEISRLMKYRLRIQGEGMLQIVDLAQAIKWRTTSRASDETLVISGLLGMDAYALARLPPQSRMKYLLIRIRELPSDVIFMLPKLKEECFNWAPATLLSKSNYLMSFNKKDAICSPEGLSAVYSAVWFQQVQFPNAGQLCIVDQTKKRYYIVRDTFKDRRGQSFSCNAFLLIRLPAPYESVPCVAVKSANHDSPEDDRCVCLFMEGMMLEGIDNKRLGNLKDQGQPPTMIQALSGRINVLLT